MPILLPCIRLVNRIIKGKTQEVKKEHFNEEFLKSNKFLLNYKMRIVKTEFIRVIKELIKRDSDYIYLLLKINYMQGIVIISKTEDIIVNNRFFAISLILLYRLKKIALTL